MALAPQPGMKMQIDARYVHEQVWLLLSTCSIDQVEVYHLQTDFLLVVA